MKSKVKSIAPPLLFKMEGRKSQNIVSFQELSKNNQVLSRKNFIILQMVKFNVKDRKCMNNVTKIF